MGDLDAIFFDIDDTLYSTSEFALRARQASADAMIAAGLRDIGREELLAELDEVVKEWSSNYEHHFDKLLRRVPRRCLKNVNTALVVASGVVAYHETKARELVPFPDAVELLQKLARLTEGAGTAAAPPTPASVRPLLGIITDGLEVKQAEKLVRLRLVQHFHPQAIFISDQIGINKPNPKLYLRACADLNLRPTSCMYVGDNPKNDIDPPNRLGMVTVRMRRRAGQAKYRDIEGDTKPRYEIASFGELEEILRRDFRLPIGASGDGASGSAPPANAAAAATAAPAAPRPAAGAAHERAVDSVPGSAAGSDRSGGRREEPTPVR